MAYDWDLYWETKILIDFEVHLQTLECVVVAMKGIRDPHGVQKGAILLTQVDIHQLHEHLPELEGASMYIIKGKKYAGNISRVSSMSCP